MRSLDDLPDPRTGVTAGATSSRSDTSSAGKSNAEGAAAGSSSSGAKSKAEVPTAPAKSLAASLVASMVATSLVALVAAPLLIFAAPPLVDPFGRLAKVRGSCPHGGRGANRSQRMSVSKGGEGRRAEGALRFKASARTGVTDAEAAAEAGGAVGGGRGAGAEPKESSKSSHASCERRRGQGTKRSKGSSSWEQRTAAAMVQGQHKCWFQQLATALTLLIRALRSAERFASDESSGG